MRNFTPITEDNPAFDVVYVLNRYFRALERVISAHHGRVNLWVGDEISAVFGLEDDPHVACRQAVDAALQMQHNLAVLSLDLNGVKARVEARAVRGLAADPAQSA